MKDLVIQCIFHLDSAWTLRAHAACWGLLISCRNIIAYTATYCAQRGTVASVSGADTEEEECNESNGDMNSVSLVALCGVACVAMAFGTALIFGNQVFAKI